MLSRLALDLALGVLGLQALSFSVLAASLLLGRPLGELTTGRLVRTTCGLSLLLSLVAAAAWLASGRQPATLSLGEWHLIEGYEFHAVLLVDALSLTFLLLATLLCGVVALFSEKYLHREPGFHRFFLLLTLFGFGDCLTVLAGSIETLYASWETLGLTSALLIGFFHERPGPVQNGLYTFAVYRCSDLCLALAMVSVYHLAHSGDFSSFLGSSTLQGTGATTVGLLLLLAAAGKAAQLPFSGWLRRAMEGPTPSTAIFYGALSVHAGAFLLLRCGPLLEASRPVAVATVVLGFSTAAWARAVGVVQTDVKCSLAYASLTQVGLIFAEIGLGLRLIPLLHVLGHALVRSMQFLRAPSLLHEMHELHSAVGRRPEQRTFYQGWLGRPAAYRRALELFGLEVLLERALLRPFLGFCRFLQRLDQWVLDRLVGPETPRV